jgi:exopolysaccharide production protein ExoQ
MACKLEEEGAMTGDLAPTSLVTVFSNTSEGASGVQVRATGISLLAAFAGAEFSCRSSYALISARWFNIGTKPGVLVGFGFSAILFGLSLFAAFGRSEYTLRWMLRARSFRWVLLYLAFAGVSLLWSGAASSASSALYWFSLLSDVAVVALLCRGFGVELAAHSLLKGFIAGACVLAALAWIMPRADDLRLGNLEYFNTNQIGNLCALALLMCSLLAIRGDSCWRGVPLFLGLTLFRSLSKATLIAFVACESYRLAKDPGKSRRQKWLLIMGAVLVCFTFLGLWEAYFAIYTTAGNQAETLTGRTGIWAWSLAAALEHPWIGNGFDAMWKIAPPFGGDLFEARHAENELLQQFFAYGLCGILLLAGIYGSLYRQVRLIQNKSQRSLLVGILIYVVVRGLAEAEPFDLLLPLWLVTVLSFLTRAETCRSLSDDLG